MNELCADPMQHKHAQPNLPQSNLPEECSAHSVDVCWLPCDSFKCYCKSIQFD